MRYEHRSPAADDPETPNACRELGIGGKRDAVALLRVVEAGCFPLTSEDFATALQAAMELIQSRRESDGETSNGVNYRRGEYIYPPRTRVIGVRLFLEMAKFNADLLPKLHAHLHAVQVVGDDSQPEPEAIPTDDFEGTVAAMTDEELEQFQMHQNALQTLFTAAESREGETANDDH